MKRTHNCEQLRKNNIGMEVYLCGWVHKIRDKGGIIWIDLRDFYGITQLKIEDKDLSIHTSDTDKEKINYKHLRREYCIGVTGKVIERSSINPKMTTGDIEILVESIDVFNDSEVPPFILEDQTDGGEDLRMKYRFLDIRRPVVKNNLLLRSKVISILHNLLNAQKFIEIETPLLVKSTPEGARDFLVPSRMNRGKFYALPQSPQLFKQLLVIGGIDRYYQIAKCFRDEDLRSDRQPEFSQLDCEMGFVNQEEEIMDLFENIISRVFNVIKNVSLPKFKRLTYDDAMAKYGTDKPDLRYDMHITDITEKAKLCEIPILSDDPKICGINISGGASFTRKNIDKYIDYVKDPEIGAKGLVYIKYNIDGSIKSSIDKYTLSEQLKVWLKAMISKPGDIAFIVAGEEIKTLKILGQLREKIATDLNLKNKDKFEPLWVTDFPLFEYNKEFGRYIAAHHPFTSPKDSDIGLFSSHPEKMHAKAYDLVINGHEVGGGSIRIHKRTIQEKMFSAIGLSSKQMLDEFGFMLEALSYGAPPHGGIAIGIARLCSILGGSSAIRDFIAFPKNNSGRDTMMNAPSEIDLQQISELKL